MIDAIQIHVSLIPYKRVEVVRRTTSCGKGKSEAGKQVNMGVATRDICARGLPKILPRYRFRFITSTFVQESKNNESSYRFVCHSFSPVALINYLHSHIHGHRYTYTEAPGSDMAGISTSTLSSVHMQHLKGPVWGRCGGLSLMVDEWLRELEERGK